MRVAVRHLVLVLAAVLGVAAVLPATAGARCPAARWVGAWGASPSHAAAPGVANATLRTVVAPHLGGRLARVRLTNRFGTGPLTIGGASLARQARGAGVVPGSARRLTFGGRGTVTVPRGADAVSDAVRLRVRPFAELAVSLFVRGASGPLTTHALASETSTWTAAGDRVAQVGATGFGTPSASWPLVQGVEVLAPGRTGTVVALGDSITDGFRSTTARSRTARDTRWPDVLARRLLARRRPLSVVNHGISGNKIRLDAAAPIPEIFGPSALARLAGDVLATPGVTDVIVLEGINDIGQPPNASAAEVVAGLQQVVARLRLAGLRVLVGTLTPAGGYGAPSYGGPAGDATRRAVNRWIRGSGVPDAVVDFDRVLRDPAAPGRLRARYDSGDHLHPNARGYAAMGAAVELAALRGPVCR